MDRKPAKTYVPIMVLDPRQMHTNFPGLLTAQFWALWGFPWEIPQIRSFSRQSPESPILMKIKNQCIIYKGKNKARTIEV
jgi:hypothetical protein